MFNFLVVRVRIELCEKRRAGESNPLHSLTVKLFEFGFSKPKWVWLPNPNQTCLGLVSSSTHTLHRETNEH